MSNRTLSPAVQQAAIECTRVLSDLHKAFLAETGGSGGAIFDALRVYMTCAAFFLNGAFQEDAPDEDLHEALHGVLDKGIGDFQFNQRLHVGSKEGS